MQNQKININSLLKTYLELVGKVYDRREYKKITYDKGYYWSEVKEMQDIEKKFLKYLTSNLDKIIYTLNKEQSIETKTYLLHLLGWSNEYKEIPIILASFFDSKNISIVNAAARALFPMIASGKTKLPLDETYKLLKKRNKYLKNKALGLLAFSSAKDLEEIKKVFSKKYIDKLTMSKESIVSSPAKMLLNRFDK